MRQSILTILGLLATSVSWAFDPSNLNFEGCEKTYITPEEVFLEKSTIHVQSENIRGVTSAIYSDVRGLYFKDIQLDEVLTFDDFFDEALFVVYSDEPSDLSQEEQPRVISDDSLEEVLLTEPQKKKTPARSTCWPYCDKTP